MISIDCLGPTRPHGLLMRALISRHKLTARSPSTWLTVVRTAEDTEEFVFFLFADLPSQRYGNAPSTVAARVGDDMPGDDELIEKLTWVRSLTG